MAERRPPLHAGVPAADGVRVALVRAGRTPGELPREFECSAQAVRNWVRQADRNEWRREDGLTADTGASPFARGAFGRGDGRSSSSPA